MELKFERTFYKDLTKIRDKKIADGVKKILSDLENASSTNQIPTLKKLKGHSTAYRIRIGDYRLGIFITGKVIEVTRFLHRKEIYRMFP